MKEDYTVKLESSLKIHVPSVQLLPPPFIESLLYVMCLDPQILFKLFQPQGLPAL